MRLRAALGVLAVAFALVGALAGCGSSNSSSTTSSSGSGSSGSTSGGSSSNKVKTIAIATPAKTDDYGWNAQGVAAAKAQAAAISAKVDAATDIGYDKPDTVLRQLAQGGANFIIAHASGFDTAAQRIAQQYKVPVMTYDIPTLISKGTLSSITTSGQQGGYLAGMLAAKTTTTGKIGIVISASDTNWFEMSGGYVAGARSVKPGIKVLFAQIGPASYDDAAGGKRVVQSEIAGGADVIFGMGDGASFGYLQAIETAKAGHKVWYIGDIGDMTPIDKQHVLLSSVLWDFNPIFKQAIADINSGSYGTHPYNLTLANGMSLLKTPYVKSADWAQIEAARKKILDGTLKVPSTAKSGPLHKLLGS
jgi:simple sugar transport system substrate-binding protein